MRHNNISINNESALNTESLPLSETDEYTIEKNNQTRSFRVICKQKNLVYFFAGIGSWSNLKEAAEWIMWEADEGVEAPEFVQKYVRWINRVENGKVEMIWKAK